MSKKKMEWNPAAWADLLKDLQDLAAQAPLLARTVSDLIALFKAQPMFDGPAVHCPAGCDCCDEAIDLQVKALAAMLQCRQCCGPVE